MRISCRVLCSFSGVFDLTPSAARARANLVSMEWIRSCRFIVVDCAFGIIYSIRFFLLSAATAVLINSNNEYLYMVLCVHGSAHMVYARSCMAVARRCQMDKEERNAWINPNFRLTISTPKNEFLFTQRWSKSDSGGNSFSKKRIKYSAIVNFPFLSLYRYSETRTKSYSNGSEWFEWSVR